MVVLSALCSPPTAQAAAASGPDRKVYHVSTAAVSVCIGLVFSLILGAFVFKRCVFRFVGGHRGSHRAAAAPHKPGIIKGNC